MDPNGSDSSQVGSKRMKLENMDENSTSLMEQYQKLLVKEYLNIENQLEEFEKGFHNTNIHLQKCISNAPSKQLEKKMKQIKDIHDQRYMLTKELNQDFHPMKLEAHEQEVKQTEKLSHFNLLSYYTHRIDVLQKILGPEKIDCIKNPGSSNSNGSEQLSTVQPQGDGSSLPMETATTSDNSLNTNGQQTPEELEETEEVPESPSHIFPQRKMKYIYTRINQLELQLTKLAQYKAMQDYPLHYNFMQKLTEVTDLLKLEEEQLTIVNALIDESSQQEQSDAEMMLQEPVEMSESLPSVTLSKKKMKKEKIQREKDQKLLAQSAPRCTFFMAHKNRVCRMIATRGKKFCGQHLIADNSPDENGYIRIPCPLDPKHSVYQHLLEQHLTVCNAKVPTHLPYFKKGINCGPVTPLKEEEEQSTAQQDQTVSSGLSLEGRNLSQLTDGELMLLVKKVLTAEKEHTEPIARQELLHETMRGRLCGDDGAGPPGPGVRKHLLQNASLVAHLENIGAFVARKPVSDPAPSNVGRDRGLAEEQHRPSTAGKSNEETDSTEQQKQSAGGAVNKESSEGSESPLSAQQHNSKSCFLEFGAGRGQLSHWVANACSNQHSLQVVLIDRGAQRYKFDTKISEAQHMSSMRLRVDIADLALELVEGVQLDSSRVHAGGKHLCGAATDLTLRCLERSNLLQQTRADGCLSSTSNDSLGSTRGLVIALCCHNRCSWQHYTGKAFFKDIGLGSEDFPAVLGLTSWAVCAAKQPQAGSAAAPVALTGTGKGSASKKTSDATTAPVGGSTSSSRTTSASVACVSSATNVPKTAEPTDSSRKTVLKEVSSEHKTKGLQQPAIPASELSSSLRSNDGDSTAIPSSSMRLEHDGSSSLRLEAGDDDGVDETHVREQEEDQLALNRYVRLGLSIADREAVGRAAKHLVNYGRVKHLRQLGMTAKLVYYVDTEITLENVALIAHN